MERSTDLELEWLRKSADSGYAAAQNRLGQYYDNGTGVSQDIAQAVVWYRKAAEQGYAIAQLNLGLSYEIGQGVETNELEAAACIRRPLNRKYSCSEQAGVNARRGKGSCQRRQELLSYSTARLRTKETVLRSSTLLICTKKGREFPKTEFLHLSGIEVRRSWFSVCAEPTGASV